MSSQWRQNIDGMFIKTKKREETLCKWFKWWPRAESRCCFHLRGMSWNTAWRLSFFALNSTCRWAAPAAQAWIQVRRRVGASRWQLTGIFFPHLDNMDSDDEFTSIMENARALFISDVALEPGCNEKWEGREGGVSSEEKLRATTALGFGEK